MSSHPPISQISDPVRLRLVQAPAGTRITHPRCHIIFDGNPLNLSQPKKRALVAGLARAMPKLYGLVEIDARTGVPKDPEMRKAWLQHLRKVKRPLEDGTSAEDAPLEAPPEPAPTPAPVSLEPPEQEPPLDPPAVPETTAADAPPPAAPEPTVQHTTEGQASFAARWEQQQRAAAAAKPATPSAVSPPAPVHAPQVEQAAHPPKPISKHERKLQHKQALKAAQQARGAP